MVPNSSFYSNYASWRVNKCMYLGVHLISYQSIITVMHFQVKWFIIKIIICPAVFVSQKCTNSLFYEYSWTEGLFTVLLYIFHLYQFRKKIYRTKFHTYAHFRQIIIDKPIVRVCKFARKPYKWSTPWIYKLWTEVGRL